MGESKDGNTATGACRPKDAVGKTRKRTALELVADLEKTYQRKKAANKELVELVRDTGIALLGLHGIGPSGAARLLVEVGDITRFPEPRPLGARSLAWRPKRDVAGGRVGPHRVSTCGTAYLMSSGESRAWSRRSRRPRCLGVGWFSYLAPAAAHSQFGKSAPALAATGVSM